ncbi:ComK protein [Ureibacillus xyleni]|uniref:ComK protein n=1 Tax=Ureibacillus xyleni TaxID=614648 RepID=A0A285RAL3_9BACL|nr:competence protein ComK [Ureibacillus xyleni]SOB90729.1 ComK protein [Ureibacillus xyleni]
MDKTLQMILMKHENLCIVPHYEGKISSIIYTKNESFKLEEKVDTVINLYCLQFASNLNGRIQASRERFGFIKKPPIVISELNSIVAMQLPVPHYSESMWIFDLSFGVEELNKQSEIEFQNGLKFKIPLSKTAVMHRKLNAFQLVVECTNTQKKPL